MHPCFAPSKCLLVLEAAGASDGAQALTEVSSEDATQMTSTNSSMTTPNAIRLRWAAELLWELIRFMINTHAIGRLPNNTQTFVSRLKTKGQVVKCMVFSSLAESGKNKQIFRSGFGSGLEWSNQDAMSQHTNPEGFTKEQVQQCDVFCVRDNSTALQSIKNSESCQFTKLFIHLLGVREHPKVFHIHFCTVPKPLNLKCQRISYNKVHLRLLETIHFTCKFLFRHSPSSPDTLQRTALERHRGEISPAVSYYFKTHLFT